jgi:hypothetical protein
MCPVIHHWIQMSRRFRRYHRYRMNRLSRRFR